MMNQRWNCSNGFRRRKRGWSKRQRCFPTERNTKSQLVHLKDGSGIRIRQVTIDHRQAIPQTDFTYIDVTAIDKERGCIAEPKITLCICNTKQGS